MTPKEIQSAIDVLLKNKVLVLNSRLKGSQDLGLTALAFALEVSPASVSRWLKGKRKINKTSAEKIQALLLQGKVEKTKSERHPVAAAKQMFLDAGGTKLEWCRLGYSERYTWILKAE